MSATKEFQALQESLTDATRAVAITAVAELESAARLIESNNLSDESLAFMLREILRRTKNDRVDYINARGAFIDWEG